MIKWFIDKNNRMPLYLQLKDLIKYFISTGAIHDGDQLPGVVQLAEDLKINFETVRKAYKELEKEKLLAMSPGRGTFATLHKDAVRKIKARQDGEADTPLRPEALMQRDVNGLFQEGRTFDEIRGLVEAILSGISRDQSKKYVIFTECNLLQVREISQTLTQALHIKVKGILLKDLGEELRKGLSQESDLLGIVTTGFHINEVKDVVGDLPIDIDILITNMSPDTLGKLSAFDKNSRFGFISRDKESVPMYKELFKSEFGRQLNLTSCIMAETDKVRAQLDSADVLLVTPPVFDEVKKLAAGRIPVFCTFDRVDPQSLKLVKDGILRKLSLS
jgi:GntR family transcriptional regulator